MTLEVVEAPVRPFKKSLKRGKGIQRKPSLKRSGGLSAVSSWKPKTPEAKLKARLWQLCKEIIRKRYGNSCYTCDKRGLTGSSWQTGHFIPSSICGAYLRYDLRNLRPQCYRCNIDLSGNGAVFYRRLVASIGQVYVDQLFADKEKIIKANRAWFEEKIKEYQQVLSRLESESVG